MIVFSPPARKPVQALQVSAAIPVVTEGKQGACPVTARISVIIPVYRSADIVSHAISSALAQTVDCKVIVVDDASGDATVAAAREAANGNDRVTILEQAVNQGPAAARNRAIAAADTEFVALLDADDQMAPGRLGVLLAFADRNGWDFVADDLYRVSDWSRLEGLERHWSSQDFGEVEMDLEMFVRGNIPDFCRQGRELGFIKPIMRRETLLAKNLFYNESMRLGEDFDLYGRALAEGVSFGLVDPQGYYAFNSQGSLSKNHSSADLKAFWNSSRTLARRNDISKSARQMLRKHLVSTHKRWAWARLIEAKHNLDPLNAIGAFVAPAPVIADLFGKVGEHFLNHQQDEDGKKQGVV